MAPLAVVPKLSRLLEFVILSTLLTVTRASTLFNRQSQACGGVAGLEQCGGDFPSSFCCAANTVCSAVNATVQSVICCPKGADCSAIAPVPCDVSQYNATVHPENQIHIENTDNIKLATCGSSCCPLGYACNNGMCIASKVSPTTPSTSSISSPTSSPIPQLGSNCTVPASPPASSFNGNSFAAGFFPGFLIGALGVVALLWVIKKRKTADRQRYSGDFGHVARTISDPIYDPMHAARTDFIRRGSHSIASTPASHRFIGTKAASSNNKPGSLTPKIKSMWDRSPKLPFGSNGGWQGLPSRPEPPPPAVRAGDRDPYITPDHTPIRAAAAKAAAATPPSKRLDKSRRPPVKQSTSSETIDVLMPAPGFLEPPKVPAMRENRMTADSGHTTFTKLMERAGYGGDSVDTIRKFGPSPQRPR